MIHGDMKTLKINTEDALLHSNWRRLVGVWKGMTVRVKLMCPFVILVPAHPGCSGKGAVKLLLLLL